MFYLGLALFVLLFLGVYAWALWKGAPESRDATVWSTDTGFFDWREKF